MKRRRHRRMGLPVTSLALWMAILVVRGGGSSSPAGGSGAAGGGLPLPQGWTQHSYKGRSYFYNAQTGESTWEIPAAPAEQQAVAAGSAWTGESTSSVGGDFASRQQMGVLGGGSEEDAVTGGYGVGGGSWNEDEAYELPEWGDMGALESTAGNAAPAAAGGANSDSYYRAGQQDGKVPIGIPIRGVLGSVGGTEDGMVETSEEINRLRAENEALRKEVERERLLVDASASNLTALVGELVQAVTDRADLQGNCTTLKHELANATMIANRLGRHLAVAKVNKAQLAEEIVDRNSKIQELESRLSEMMEDVGVLDKALAHYIEGGGAPNALSWARFRKTILDPLVPNAMKGPTADELEISNLQSDISRMKANNTALAESLASKSDLISELNSRIAGFEEDSVKRRQSLAALKSGVDDLTLEVESKKERIELLEGEHRRSLQGILGCTVGCLTAARADTDQAIARISELEAELVDVRGALESALASQSAHAHDSTVVETFSSAGAAAPRALLPFGQMCKAWLERAQQQLRRLNCFAAAGSEQ